MKKRLTKIGVLVILGMLMFAASVPTALAYTWSKDERLASHMIVIDHEDGVPDDEEAFAIAHDTSEEILLIVMEDGGKVGIGDDDPDLKLEVGGSSGDGYFGVSAAVTGDGDIFIIDSSGKVGIATTSPSHMLTIQSANDNTLRLIGPDGVYGYGARLNFGDQDFVYIEEDTDDKLYIYARYRTAIMGGDVGIGTTTPGAKLDVEVSSGGAATIGSSGNSATGLFAIALGYDTTASGDYSTAMGRNTNAGDHYSTAMGWDTTASLGGTAMGYSTTANGGTAMGHSTIASSGGTAMGYSTIASGSYSTAMGDDTEASGITSTAMGFRTTASGRYSTATGWYTTAYGDMSTAMGANIDVNGQLSFGINLGPYTRTITQDNTMAIMGGKVGIGYVSPTNLLSVYGSVDISGNLGIGTTSPSTKLHVNGDVAFGAGSELTIIDEEVTVTHSYHLIDASGGTADLDTINGGDVAGQILIITAASSDIISVEDDTGNLVLAGGIDFSMDDQDTMVLIWDGTTSWIEISRSEN